jgi:hypothetical protein
MTLNCQCCSSVYLHPYRVTYLTEWHATVSVAVLYIFIRTAWHIWQNDIQLSVLQFCISSSVPCDISDRMTRNCQCCSSVYLHPYCVTYLTEWHATVSVAVLYIFIRTAWHIWQNLWPEHQQTSPAFIPTLIYWSIQFRFVGDFVKHSKLYLPPNCDRVRRFCHRIRTDFHLVSSTVSPISTSLLVIGTVYAPSKHSLRLAQ